MKKPILNLCIYLSFLLSFLLLNIHNANAQEVSVYKGLKTITYSTINGDVVISYPEKLYSGTQISGKLFVFPKAKEGKKREKQLSFLNKTIFGLGEVKIQGAGMFTTVLPEDIQMLFSLKDHKGKQLFSVEEKLNTKPACSPTYVPNIIQKGYTEMIRCTSNGLYEDVKLSINNTQLGLMAVSETEIFFECPDVQPGKAKLELETGDILLEREINVLQFDVGVGKSALLPAEQTTLTLMINGMENVEDDVELSLVNNTVAIISLEGGNEQSINITPAEVGESGMWERTLQITGQQRGGFSIIADLILPEELPQEITDPQQIVDCDLDGYPVLVSAEMCQQLQQKLQAEVEVSIDYPSEVFSEFSVNTTFNELPEIIKTGEKLALNLNFVDAYIPHAVIFDIYDLSDGSIQSSVVDSIPEDGFGLMQEFSFDPGIYGIRARISHGQNQEFQTSTYIIQQEITIQDIEQSTEMFSFTDQIRRIDQSATRERNRIRELEKQRDDNISRAREEDDQAFRDERIVRDLERIDKVLESTEETYSEQLKQLLDSIIRFPPVLDTALLRGQLNRLQDALELCANQLDGLQNEQIDLRNELPAVEQARLDAYHKITDLLRQSGYNFASHRRTNSNGDLEYGFGLIFGRGSNIKFYRGAVPVQIASEVTAQERLIRNLNQRARQVRKRLDELPEIINSVQDECDRLQQEVNNARDAYEEAKILTGQFSHLHLQRDELCRQIKNILNRLVLWCKNNPDICVFQNQLDDFEDVCPTDTIQVTEFWAMFNQIINSKQGLEEQHRQQAEQHRDSAEELRSRTRQNRDDIDAANAELERLARERRDLEDKLKEAAKRKAEADRIREQERKRPKPKPYLEEEIDPSDRQLKLQAKRLLFNLVRHSAEYMSNPCSCEAKALTMANNTNTSISDLIGSIAVGVAFAPLEAFPGFGLAIRLGIGAIKALLSTVYGGANLTDELVGNLFKVIGGEIFPKLVGNEFAGNRLNDLASGGLNKIMEAEGVRTLSWEGSTNSKHCGRISGKTTMMFNPRTGWVVMMIKISGCPLVIVKYKVNDDGVPITEPNVRQIR